MSLNRYTNQVEDIFNEINPKVWFVDFMNNNFIAEEIIEEAYLEGLKPEDAAFMLKEQGNL